MTVNSNRGTQTVPVRVKVVDEPVPHLEPDKLDLGQVAEIEIHADHKARKAGGPWAWSCSRSFSSKGARVTFFRRLDLGPRPSELLFL